MLPFENIMFPFAARHVSRLSNVQAPNAVNSPSNLSATISQTSPDEVEPGKLGESNLFVFLRSQVAVCLRLRITEVREFCNLFFTLQRVRGFATVRAILTLVNTGLASRATSVLVRLDQSTIGRYHETNDGSSITIRSKPCNAAALHATKGAGHSRGLMVL